MAEAAREPVTAVSLDELEERIVSALRTVFDPEIPVNIYGIELTEEGDVEVLMTLTAPGCPVAQTFPGEVEQRILAVDGVNSAHVEIVWEPPWTQDRMTEAAKLELGML